MNGNEWVDWLTAVQNYQKAFPLFPNENRMKTKHTFYAVHTSL